MSLSGCAQLLKIQTILREYTLAQIYGNTSTKKGENVGLDP